MTAQEIYEIMKALNALKGNKEDIEVVKKFVEQQLNEKIDQKPNITWNGGTVRSYTYSGSTDLNSISASDSSSISAK